MSGRGDPDSASRRRVLQVAGLGLLAFRVDGAEVLLSAAEARQKGVAPRVLIADEVAIVETLGEALLPGARASGIAHFLDHQLAADPPASLLMIRYLDVPPPYIDFYRPALAAVARCAVAIYQRPLTELDGAQLTELVGAIAQGDPPGWQGPPAPLFYFALRSDAVDVTYGTPEGFEKLGIPYMAHIMPPSRW